MTTEEKLDCLKEKLDELAREFREARRNTNRITDNIDSAMTASDQSTQKQFKDISEAVDDLKKRLNAIENQK